ncbi:transferrin receptor 1a isoform X1 [Takifugu rubripes]|uniref:transferrin receptor 1a isoform X1 n=1 Tax=Takifugu rubripes TaxID=31033 RepID=UPI001145FC3D|nr:transferrin receptor protein 1 isoform X1 [Takifugu rubripes]
MRVDSVASWSEHWPFVHFSRFQETPWLFGPKIPVKPEWTRPGQPSPKLLKNLVGLSGTVLSWFTSYLTDRSFFFNGEPHSYTRFNLTQNMEGDNSQVEMKLSSDVDEEVGGNGVGEHLNHNAARTPYIAQKLRRTPRNLCFLAATVLLMFIIGYLIGYLVHRKKEAAPSCAATVLSLEDPLPHQDNVIPIMNWDDVKKLLFQKVSAANFEPVLADLSTGSHQAGSPGDEALANKLLRKFSDYGMKSWTDDHFVKVQDPPVSGYNRIVFKNGKEERPSGFLSYSACGTVSGAVLYGHYGEESDFMMLRSSNIDLSGRVVLVRAGRNSFAEKVANAAKLNASAVLIYPDPEDYSLEEGTGLFGHVHLGSGDPYTPAFPSFNHTQFPPVESSGLPKILAQTITARMAADILKQLGGQNIPMGWKGINRMGDESDTIRVEVNNVLTEKKISNVFGVIKGIVDSDRYLVIGAQRDAWGPGFATATVGTSVLLELARSISEMTKEGFEPRRSIVFASWSAGEYGSVGATEWLEGYLSSLSMKAFTYINLDGVIAGRNGFKVAGSPLMHSLILSALKEVKSPNPAMSLFSQYASGNWESNILEPLKVDNAAYPFLAFSGIPSISFRFTSGSKEYPYFGTMLDTRDKLNTATSNQVPQLAEVVTRFAGHMALRLVHDHLLKVDLAKYDRMIRGTVSQIYQKVNEIQRLQPQLFPKALTVQWLISASGAYSRASRNLVTDIKNSDLDDIEMCRVINDRIMTVERDLLSPYVSPRESPFRHILLGSGPHTLQALSNHLNSFRSNNPEADADLFRNQFALATWTIQGCANSLAGNIWSLYNQI